MTEKRFAFVIDNGEYTFYDLSENGEIMNMIDTEDMLNALHHENKRLNIFIKRLHDIADENGAISRIRMKSEIHLFKEELE